jgi:RNA polymerase sigma-70 factor (ECF subfamily)
LPNAQIGQIMGRSEGAIKSLYHRTLEALRQDLVVQSR